MREKELMRVRTVRGTTPEEFDNGMNSIFLEVEPDAITNIVQLSELTATVYYKVIVKEEEEETLLDKYREAFGKVPQCGECPYFAGSTDKRTKKGICVKSNTMKKCNSLACEQYMKEELGC